ncbi:MAG: hypothetical protein MI923_03040 [Phycisphaerales bacterium]|nr:hypothetical protein [Phycisphaerales bacterium]
MNECSLSARKRIAGALGGNQLESYVRLVQSSKIISASLPRNETGTITD